MTDREILYKGVSRAAWAYLFVYLDINLGTVSILPTFVGYWMFLSVIRLLAPIRRELALLRPLGIFLMLTQLVSWLMSWSGGKLDGKFALLDLLVCVALLYFHFQLFTDLAALAEIYQKEDSTVHLSLLRWRTVQTILITCMAFMGYPLRWFDWWEQVTVFMAVVYIIAGFFLIVSLFRLRKAFLSDEPQEHTASASL